MRLFIVALFSAFLAVVVYYLKNGYILTSENVHASLKINNENVNNKKGSDPLTLNSIFKDDNGSLEKVPDEKTVTLIATGDVIPARSVNFQSKAKGNFKWAFEKTAGFLKSGDVTLINLETPLFSDCKLTNEGMIFCGDKKNIEGLIFAGVDVASFANNHMGNHGEDMVIQTRKLLEESDIKVTGIDGPTYLTIKGVKFAFLGYNRIGSNEKSISWADEEKIKSEVAKARGSADVVVVEYHWGAEYRSQPDDTQKKLGHLTIDAGADLVIGNHPHWIQPVEIYKGKLITYAHGNFIFDQMWSEETRLGVVGKYTFYGKNLIDVTYYPIKIQDYGQPYFLEGQEKSNVLKQMYSEAQKLSNQTN